MAIVLVTGGSSGIGLATVVRLAAVGDRVYAASRHPERAPAIDGVIPMRLDVTDPAAADAAVASVVEDAGRLDVLVNNAGMGALLPVEETPDETMHAIFETNYFGPIRLARAAVPVMRAQGGGRIVNVTSMNDAFPAPFLAHYSASKAALASASLAFDAEVHGFDISVTVVAPGFFLTPMAQSLGDAVEVHQPMYRTEIDAMQAGTPSRLASAGDPDTVAAAIEVCIRADDPPARVVVGADAGAMQKLVDDGTADDLAALLRSFVAGRATP